MWFLVFFHQTKKQNGSKKVLTVDRKAIFGHNVSIPESKLL